MAEIKISDLNPAGSSLFSGSESYLDELTTEEMAISGGLVPITISISITVSITTYSWNRRRR